MPGKQQDEVGRAKAAALRVLLHNTHGPYHGLPRTAGWEYPEPYTRDLMIASLGILASGNQKLIASLRRVLETLAKNQSPHGHMPSLVHDPEDRGACDTTPLFLLALGFFRQATGESSFLADAAQRALTWMQYQSPSDRVMVAQQPTTDWRDEQWVMGFGLFVNAVVHSYLRLYGRHEQAALLRQLMSRFTIEAEAQHRHVHEGLVLRRKPYYALWSYKLYRSERFDLLGNSLAILSGLAVPSRCRHTCVGRGRVRCHDTAGRPCRGPPAQSVSLHSAGRSGLAAALCEVQPTWRVSQRRCLAVRLRLLRCRLCGGRAPANGPEEARGPRAWFSRPVRRT